MAELILAKKQRGIVLGKLTRIRTFFDAFTKVANTLDEVEVRFGKLADIEREFMELHANVLATMEEDDQEDQTAKLGEFEEQLFAVCAKAQELRRLFVPEPEESENSSRASSHPFDNVQQMKVPPITVQPFAGKRQDWLRFKEIFMVVYGPHRKMEDLERFHRLRECLRNGALQLIESLTYTNASFDLAWKMLEKKYNNKHLLISLQIQKLLNLRQIQESSSELENMLDSINSVLGTLHSLEQSTASWDMMIVTIAASKLDEHTREFWETHIPDKELPTWELMEDCLQKRAKILESSARQRDTEPKRRRFESKGVARGNKSFHASSSMNCVKCNRQHPLEKCTDFINLGLSQKFDLLRKHKICFNCLSGSHLKNNCTSTWRCRLCQFKHHSILHYEKKNPDTENQQSTSTVAHATNQIKNQQVMLATAVVFIKDFGGKNHECRALLDIGSTENFICESLVQRLKLKRQSISLPIGGINDTSSRIKASVKSDMSSLDMKYERLLKFLVIPKITGNLPYTSINVANWNIPEGIKLADPAFNKAQKVDILLGAGLFLDLLKDGKLTLDEGLPILQNTKLGWIVAGNFDWSQKRQLSNIEDRYCGLVNTQTLSQQVEKFWQLEGCDPAEESSEKELCEKLFIETHSRQPTGQYMVQLPMRDSVVNIGDTKRIAQKRLEQQLLRLEKNVQLKELYNDFMAEYENLGHMEEVGKHEKEPACTFYFPHHGVLKMSSSTTKLRVVFNGSQKSSTGTSLNEILLNGGMVQDDLFEIMLRFRSFRYVFTADVEKMYRQILVDPIHRDLQRIMWKRPKDAEIKCFRLNTVTYGTACAPFLATRVLKQLALDEAETYPAASRAILHNTYVDDVLSGSDDLHAAINTQKELQDMLSTAGMHLHKWCANHPALIENIDVADQEKSSTDQAESGRATVKALGIIWCPEREEFSFKWKSDTQRVISKREILSAIASTFDPLGLISPVVVKLKIFMQKLWKLDLGWDDELAAETSQEWENLNANMNLLEQIRVSRCFKSSSYASLQLHGFADASQQAYAACIYVRSEDENGLITVRLVCSKTRVSPLKDSTIPRLELCGAVVLAALVKRVNVALDIPFQNITLWSDSMIVLAWLKKSQPQQFKVFVQNRVEKIQNLTAGMQWRHVRTKENPADLASRGITPSELSTSELWWNGPSFLKKKEDDWPVPLLNFECSDELNKTEWLKETKTVMMLYKNHDEDFIINCSSFRRLQRITAYVLRFIDRTRNKKILPKNCIVQLPELRKATTCLIKLVQSKEFAEDIGLLIKNKSVAGNSSLKSLNPFLDTEGVVRVGGRLEHSSHNYDMKHQILLPEKHHLTELFVRSLHVEHLHIGQSGMLAIVRQNYWPVNARNIIRRITSSCIRCFKVAPVSVEQLMGQLPAQRLTEAHPFQRSGVDYGGPFFVKQGGPRSVKLTKVWLALFVCESTKAIHLELVSELTSQCFIAALHRFISRRGICSDLYSDNGTCFVGANKELKELYKIFNSDEHNKQLTTTCAEKGILWHFNPAGSPHFGGLFEAGIKQAKVHLKRIVGLAHLTYEELNTIFIQIEAILNSRPLTAMSQDPNDLSVLTPGHFLVGREITGIPEPCLTHLKLSHLGRWQRLQQMKQHFWKRWNMEYISQLQQRKKWQKGSTAVSIGQLALIKDENQPPLKWRLGRIAAVHPGSDGIVRAVTLRTISGNFTRAVTRICILPINTLDSSTDEDSSIKSG